MAEAHGHAGEVGVVAHHVYPVITLAFTAEEKKVGYSRASHRNIDKPSERDRQRSLNRSLSHISRKKMIYSGASPNISKPRISCVAQWQILPLKKS